jgi:nuclear cap-binding protein subunit 1
VCAARAEPRLQVTPDPSTPAGYAVRAELLDTVDIFEVNRKECARILLEYPKWTPAGTFRPRPGEGAADAEAAPGKDWQLESTLVEVRCQYVDAARGLTQ